MPIIRKAVIADIKQIHKLVNDFAGRNLMLPRAINELYDRMRDFLVCDNDGEIIAVGALKIYGEDLAEIRSLAVLNEHQGKGIGKSIVESCLQEAGSLGIKRVFALTYRPDFFKKLNFSDIDKANLPQKIWGDCMRCPKFPECDEHAVIIYL